MSTDLGDLIIAVAIIFNAGMILRVIMVLIAGMADEETNTKKIIGKYIKVLIIGNCMAGLVGVIKRYF